MLWLLFSLSASLTAAADPAPLLDNGYVRVVQNASPCAAAAAKCGRRIVVALSSVALESSGKVRTLSRGDVVTFTPAESYTVTGPRYLEIVVKDDHPAPTPPAFAGPPEKNTRLHDDRDYFIFEEQLPVGDTRARHGHSQRLVVVVNETRLQQWPDGAGMLFKNQVPDDVHFNEPVVHVAKNVGAQPLRNIVIEFKPAPAR